MQKISLHVGRTARLCRALLVSAAVLFAALLCRPVQAQDLERILPPPFFGTFYLISLPDMPYPFDPYFGKFPVYAWNGGTYLIDDSPANAAFAGGGMESMAGPAPCDPCPEGDGGGGTNIYYLGGWTTKAGLKFAAMPYVTNATLYVTRLEGVSPGKAYEIYRTLNLLSTSHWTRVAVGTNGQTNFSLSLSSTNGVFLAASVEDQDLDGLSDAYEYLALRTTNLWDFDSDGMPDFWEMAHGLNFTNRNDATNDVDGDGIKNLAEYVYEASSINPGEPLGPSSRRTPLVISEIMYNPAPGGTEFIEIYNTHHLPQKLDGFTLGLPIDPSRYYIFTNTTLAPGAFIAVTPVTSLPSSPQLQLRNSQGAVLLEVNYSDNSPWPKAADGTGQSLVLSHPSYGENDVRAWSPSARGGGSRSNAEPVIQDFKGAVRLNEFLAYPSGTNWEFIELQNTSSVTQDISGWHLSCRANTLAEYTFPAGTILLPRGFLHLFGNTNNPTPSQFPFPLSNGGDSIFLSTADTNRVVDAVNFEDQEQGISTGRSPDGGPVFRELATRTPGGTNAPALVRNMVINEIMYNSISGSDTNEYVELYNRGATNQSLSGWSFDGITFTFPSFVLAPSYFVVIAKDTHALLSLYPGRFTNEVNLFGNYGGSLGNSGERIALKNSAGVVVNEVTYGDGGRWGQWSDGGGSSLELIDPRSDNRLPANWADSLPPASAQWTSLSVTGIVMTTSPGGPGPIGLELMMLGAGECLVDDVEVRVGTNNLVGNGTFNGACLTVLTNETPTCGTNAGSCWFAQGTHEFSELLTTSGTTNGPCLKVRATERGDYVANRIVTCWATNLTTGTTCIISAKIKWLRGHPELVFRLRGSYMEAVAHMTTAGGGTPGLANSTAVSNAPPAIWNVQHFPVVPAANEVVTISARVHDSDGVTNVVVKYRNDTVTTNTALALHDDGLNGDALPGDGLFSAALPAQTTGTIIAFIVEATDALGATSRFPKAQAVFPGDSFQRECVVQYGDGQPTGYFGIYRLWLTAANYNQWASRNRVHNSSVDATFVYGSSRAIYNAGVRYAGTVNTSTYANNGTDYNTPIGKLCGYALDFPADDRFLGATGAGLDYDSTNPRYMASEQLAMSLADRLELPNNYRRFTHLYLRGNKRTPAVIYEDAQQPNSDFLSEWFPDQDKGQLFKLEVWWTIADAPLVSAGQPGATLELFNRSWPGTTNTSLDLAHYRLNWLPRAVDGKADDYGAFSNLVLAVQSPTSSNYFSSVTSQIDYEQWMRTLAFERAV